MAVTPPRRLIASAVAVDGLVAAFFATYVTNSDDEMTSMEVMFFNGWFTLLALALLVALQFVITWSSVRWGWVRRTVTGEPTLLLFRGEYLQAALRRARVTDEHENTRTRAALPLWIRGTGNGVRGSSRLVQSHIGRVLRAARK